MDKATFLSAVIRESHDNADFCQGWNCATVSLDKITAAANASPAFQSALKSRIKTRRANRNAKITRQVMADMGLNRVRGALGGTYYE